MKFVLCLWVLALCAMGAPARAQEPGTPSRLFSDSAIARAVAAIPVEIQQIDPRADWSRVVRLSASTPIVLRTRAGTSKRCRFVSADAATLTVVDLEDPSAPTLRVARDDVEEIMQRTGRRGSRLGAAIGVGAGVFLGVGSAIALAYKDCGGNCADEKFLIGLSLIGMPVAGGFAGYYLPGDGRKLTTVYLRPSG